jgi:LPXTG-site transpeptidase (sortase) family protein
MPLVIVVMMSGVFGVVLVMDQMQSEPPEAAQPSQASNATPTVAEPVLVSMATQRPTYSLYIPALEVTGRVVHLTVDGASWSVQGLGNNIGHLIGTSWFDDEVRGNIVLVGHVELRDGKQGIFAGLNGVPIGETIVVRSGNQSRRYRIDVSYKTEPDDLAPLFPSSQEIITLITCDDYDFFSNTYLSRHIVVASLVPHPSQ